jgi:very-short-patch-repair endonuclease
MKKTHLSYNVELTADARANRKTANSPEAKLWRDALSRKKLDGYKFTRQKPIGNFILDFYCSSLLLGIEIDGDSHARQMEYDDERTKRLNAMGVKIVRYTNREVMKSFGGVCDDLFKQVKVRKEELRK